MSAEMGQLHMECKVVKVKQVIQILGHRIRIFWRKDSAWSVRPRPQGQLRAGPGQEPGMLELGLLAEAASAWLFGYKCLRGGR